jgi:threonine dehydrogenase-like Zn-dependent dehydrogenase
MTFLNVKAISGGVVQASGNSKNQNIDINTGGQYKGKELHTEKTDVIIRAAGEALVHATKEVTAKVRAGGSVYIYGNPEKVDENTVFGGKIVRK